MRLKVLVVLVGMFLISSEASGFAQQPPDAVIARGHRLFLLCASCHNLTESNVAKIGPSLSGVIGRKAASLADYAYSPALKATDFNWDAETLDQWLIDPVALVPGTRMAFAGFADAADRAAIIAYRGERLCNSALPPSLFPQHLPGRQPRSTF